VPRATCRIIPARSNNLWLTTSASAGSSLSVGASSSVNFMSERRRRRAGDRRPPAIGRSLTLGDDVELRAAVLGTPLGRVVGGDRPRVTEADRLQPSAVDAFADQVLHHRARAP